MREGHELSLTIEPVKGRRKTILLKRAKYIFRFSNIDSIKEKGIEILVPSLANECSFELRLENGCYRLRALNQQAIPVNGLRSFDCYLHGKTEVLLGYSILRFNMVQEQSETLEPEISKFSKNFENISIVGETGVGKGYMARKIYDSCPKGEFIQINISSFSKNLVESELFGHVKGAFTGANQDRVGVIQRANGGTLFIDEIDSLDLEIQVKLLNFLDDGLFYKVGSSQPRQSQCRLIFSSGRDLKDLVKMNKFRKDLYFRISTGFQISLSPLRERPTEIIRVLKKIESKHLIKISPKLFQYYLNYSWPGNYRQLLGHLNKKISYASTAYLKYDEIDRDLESIDMVGIEEKKFKSMKDLKKEYIRFAYRELGFSVERASEILKVSQKTIENYLAGSTGKNGVDMDTLDIAVDF